MDWSDRIFIWAVLLAVPLLLIVFPLYLLFGGLRSFARRPLERCFREICLHQNPEPGDVAVVYHTYRGLLLWSLQEEHRFFAPPDDALRLLKRLLRFNLTWGLLSYGVVIIPFVAIFSYFSQKNSIESQRHS